MEQYDYVIAGGGAAGLSLALEIVQSDLKDRSILVIDREQKTRNDRTWCFWTDHPTGLEPILYRSWSKIRFQSPVYNAVLPTQPFHYHMLRSADYYAYAHDRLSRHPKVTFVTGNITAIQDKSDGVQVGVGNQSYFGRFAFDSILRPTDLQIDFTRYHVLKQHFRGWLIETETACFDPEAPVLFDFRTPQDGAMRFIYILPSSPTQALVEYTLFSANLLAPEDYDLGLKQYITKILKTPAYQVREVEDGVIPMTDYPFPRRGGQHILYTGTKGGRVKSSSGYAFWRIQQDAAAIVRSILSTGHPFAIPPLPPRYRLFDSILLQIMYRHPEDCAGIFSALFTNNPVPRIFRFLNEDGNWKNDLRILASLPPYRFVQALIRFRLFGKI